MAGIAIWAKFKARSSFKGLGIYLFIQFRGGVFGETFEQAFDQCHSTKCSKQVFDSVSRSVCQNFQPNLGNFQPNPKLFQPNPDRIFTYFSTESWIGLLPRLALQER